MDAEPLKGITVLDFTQSIAGPVCTTLLGDFGAEVVMIEPPSGSSHRHFVNGSIFPNFGRNKESVVLDLKSDGTEEVIAALARTTDIVVHNFATGTMERLGCDYESLREHNDDIIYCSITGYGESGPYSERPAYDPIAQAMSGMMHMTGESDRKPSRVGGSTLDIGAGIYAAFAIMLSLWRRERQGEGSKVQVSLLDTAATIMGYWYTYADVHGDAPDRDGSRYAPYAPYSLFEASDGLVYIAAPLPKQWERLCDVLGREDWLDDSRFETNDARLENRDTLAAALEEEFGAYTQEELVDLLLNENIPAAKLQTVLEAASDEHLYYRGSLTDVENTDGEKVTAIGRTIHFDDEGDVEFRPPPQLGQDTDEVLASIGFSQAEIAALREDGSIR